MAQKSKKNTHQFDAAHIDALKAHLIDCCVGNGFAEDDIQIEVVKTDAIKFNANFKFKLQPFKEEKTTERPDENMESVYHGENIDAIYSTYLEKMTEGGESEKSLQEMIDQNFETILESRHLETHIDAFEKSYATGHECHTCAGAKETQCPQCSGRGKDTCTTCLGNTTLKCPKCNGLGIIEAQIQKTVMENNDEGDAVTKTNVEIATSQCETCTGSGRIECDACDKKGVNTCENCDGQKTVSCETCDATGQVFDVTQFKVKSDIIFDTNISKLETILPEESADYSLSDLIETGLIIFEPKSFKIKNMNEQIFTYQGVMPYAELKITHGKGHQDIKLIGLNGDVAEITPFLNVPVLKKMKDLRDALNKKDIFLLMRVFEKVLNLKVCRDALALIKTYTKKEAAGRLHTDYLNVLGPKTCRVLIKTLSDATIEISKKAKYASLGAGFVVNAIIILIYAFIFWGSPVSLRSGFISILDFVALAGLGVANIKGLRVIQNIIIEKMFEKAGTKTSINLEIAQTKQDYAIIAGIVFLALYTVMSLVAHPPLWAIRLLGVS